MSMPHHLKAALDAEIARTPSPTREQLARRTLIGLTVGLVLAGILGALNAPIVGARAPMFMAAITLILVMFAGRTLLASVSTSLWVSPGNAKRLVVMPYVALAAVAAAYARTPGQPHTLSGDMACGTFTMIIAIAIGVAIIIARRRTEPLRPVLKAFLLGSFAASIAAALVFLHCPLEEARHFALGHLGSALIAGGLLGGIASRVIRV